MVPQLSIAIPTFNRATELRECLLSLTAEDTGEVEIIVSDNASTDLTSSVLDKFAQDTRISCSRNATNLGANPNGLKTLSLARGRYVLLFTDDSVVVPGALSRLVSVLDQYPDVGLITSRMAYRCVKSGEITSYRSDYPRSRYFPPGNEGLEHLWMGTRVWPRLVIRRDLLDLDWMAKHPENIYPSMYLAGRALKDAGGFYSHDVMVVNNLSNVNYWEYPDDFGVLGRLDIIRKLASSPSERRLTRKLVQSLLREDLHWILDTSKGHAIDWLRTIPEIRRERVFWQHALRWKASNAFNSKGVQRIRHFRRRVVRLPQRLAQKTARLILDKTRTTDADSDS